MSFGVLIPWGNGKSAPVGIESLSLSAKIICDNYYFLLLVNTVRSHGHEQDIPVVLRFENDPVFHVDTDAPVPIELTEQLVCTKRGMERIRGKEFEFRHGTFRNGFWQSVELTDEIIVVVQSSYFHARRFLKKSSQTVVFPES